MKKIGKCRAYSSFLGISGRSVILREYHIVTISFGSIGLLAFDLDILEWKGLLEVSLRKKWINVTEEDLRSMGVDEWR